MAGLLDISSGYYPGYWQQDVYTIPIEAAIVGGLSLVSMRGRSPVWPFNNEVTAYPERKGTRHSKFLLVPSAVALGTITFSTLEATNENFPLWLSGRGLVHAHLVNEIFTSAAKVGFARKRPFYDGVKQRGEILREDDLKSFFSGHSSHAFTFAAYSSALMFRYGSSTPLNYALSTVFSSAAIFVAAARVIDGQHNFSDVFVGAVVGTATGIYYENRAANTFKLLKNAESKVSSEEALTTNKVKPVKSHLVVFPSVSKIFSGNSVPTMNVEMRF